VHPRSFHISYFDHLYYRMQLDDWKNGEKYKILAFEGDLKKSYDEQTFSNKDFFELPKDIRKEFLAKERKLSSAAYMKYGMLEMIGDEALSDSQGDILCRFAKVFEQAYTRFLDIQQAESQAREAQIETALERVRSRSMGMQKSEELKDVVKIIFNQLAHLNINAEHAGIVVDYEPKKDWHFWIAETQDIPAKVSVPYLDLVWDQQFTEAKKKGKNFFATLMDFEEKNSFYKVLLPHVEGLTKKVRDFYFNCPGLAISTVIEKDIGLYIENFSGIPYSSEENDILRRFAKVFQQTYTRFLDLKKAEAQARESQIEAALEKVRSRSLAMHKSEELKEVVAVVLNKLQEVEIAMESRVAVIVVFKEGSRDFNQWVASPTDISNTYISTPYFEHVILSDFWKAKESGLDFYSKSYSKEEKDKYFNHFFEHSYFKHFEGLEDQKKWALEKEFYTYSPAFEKNSSLGIADFSGEPLSENDITIIKRFAKVFEQAYIRFLDLQKAEAQAREAEIELAVERIRSQAMAMKESSELLDIVVTMRREFLRLGHEAHYFWHMMWLPDKYEKAMTSGDGKRIGMVMELPRHIHGDIKLLKNWERSNEPLVVYPMDAEAAIDYVDKMISLGDFKQVDPNAPSHDDIRHIGGLTFIMARTTHGEIGYSLPGVVDQPPEEDLTILKRFAGAFDLAHRRFLDLKKSEAQAREVQIELALERVRARTMAMQHSDELQEASFLLDEQVRELGIKTWGCAFNIYREKDSIEWFGNEKGLLPTYTVPRKGIFKKYYDLGQKGAQMHIQEFKGAKCISHYEYMSTLPVIGDVLKQLKKTNGSYPEYQIDHVVYFKYGYLLFITTKEAPDAHDIFKRFAQVFEQTYTRFLDLKKAETQARE
ncbi:MAG: hypothetical protein KJO53_01670, partial [Eudoraea sp.]|nr:hypothetical protein [Eudoraea sp.]